MRARAYWQHKLHIDDELLYRLHVDFFFLPFAKHQPIHSLLIIIIFWWSVLKMVSITPVMDDQWVPKDGDNDFTGRCVFVSGGDGLPLQQ